MRIDRSNFSSLTIQFGTWFFKLIGVLFFAVGLVLLYLMTEQYSFRCQASVASNAGTSCDVTTHTLLGTSTQNIDSLLKAYYVNRTSKKSSGNYYIKLKTPLQRIQLNSMGSVSKSSVRTAAKTINLYLKHPKGQELTIGVLQPYWFFILPAAFIFISLLLMIIPKSVNVILDSNTGTVRIIRKNSFSKNSVEYALSDVENIQLERSRSSNSGAVYRIAFQLKNGECTPLTNSYDNLLTSKLKAIEAMNQFLNLSPDESVLTIKRQTKNGVLVFTVAAVVMLAIAAIVFLPK